MAATIRYPELWKRTDIDRKEMGGWKLLGALMAGPIKAYTLDLAA